MHNANPEMSALCDNDIHSEIGVFRQRALGRILLRLNRLQYRQICLKHVGTGYPSQYCREEKHAITNGKYI